MDSRLVSRACPSCGNDRPAALLRKGGLTLVRCAVCSMVYATPIEEALGTGEFYDQLATGFYLSSDKLQADYAPVRFERELKLFRRFCKSGRVLDVGCSTGAFLARLRQQFPNDYETLGIDVAGPALDYAESHGVPVRREPFLTTELGSFNAVTFWAVLEHLADPTAFLSRAADVLESGGFCFILVPNFQSLAVRCLGSKYRYILPQHVNYFSPATLRQWVARQPGFQVVYSGSSHFNPLVILQDWKGGGMPASDQDRTALLKRTTRYKQSALLRPVKLAWRAVEAMLACCNLADNLVIVLQRAG